MIFLIIVAAVSLLISLVWAGLFVYSACINLMKVPPNFPDRRMFLLTLLNGAVAACLLRILLGDSRGFRLEIGASGVILLSAVLYSGPSLREMIGGGSAQIFLVLWSVINTACPLTFVAAMTALRRIPWQRRTLADFPVKNR